MTPTTPLQEAPPYKPQTIFSAVQNALAKGIHDQNFKNGAFCTSIPYSTAVTQTAGVITAFNILLASPELSAEEKEIVKGCRIQFIHLRNRYPVSGEGKMGAGEDGELGDRLVELRGMFERDAARREPENELARVGQSEDEDGMFIFG
jgi:hypothetical protein